MRNPPFYGSVVDLGKNRRKPLAVRVPVGKKLTEDKREITQYRYIGYFERTKEGRKEALKLLADYNDGKNINTNIVNNNPTFLELATEWKTRHIERAEAKKGQFPKAMEKQLRISLDKCKPIHNMRIDRIRYQDVQDIADSVKTKSSCLVSRLKMILFETFELARKQKYITENFIPDIDFVYASSKKSIHTDFKQEEIDKLWEVQETDDVAKALLIMIYTGLRTSEFLEIKNENIRLSERYMIGGMKTDAGTDRTIPIHSKIAPIIEYFMSDDEFLYKTKKGKKWSYTRFTLDVFFPEMEKLGMKHKPHDTRYTTATMLDRANVNPNVIKDILGHAREGMTNRVYVQKNLQDLLDGIDAIK